MANAPKVVGDLCPDCGTAMIAGRNGEGYCKPCYIKWAEANKAVSNTGSTANQKQVVMIVTVKVKVMLRT